MKIRIIILLAVLLTGGLSASPNRSCNGVRCAASAEKQTPVKAIVMMIDEAELMPLHYFLRNF